jgi:hypothetical protein
VHIQHHMNIPNIEKSIEEQLNRELQVIKGNRKRELVSFRGM